MKALVRITLGIGLLLGIQLVAVAEEILIHSGPIFSTPSLGLKTPSSELPGEDIYYEKRFYVDPLKLPRPAEPFIDTEHVNVSAARAIELAIKRYGLPNNTKVTRLDLHSTETEKHGRIDYYLIEYIVDGSHEHRVILMNELILKPRFIKVAKPKD